MADSPHRIDADLTAQNTGTDWLQVRLADGGGKFDVSVSDTFVANVTLQRKEPHEAASAAVDVEAAYTTATEKTAEIAGDWDVRLFIKTGGFTSGTARCRLKKTLGR